MSASSVRHHNQMALGLLRINNPDEYQHVLTERHEDQKAADKKRIKKQQAKKRRAAAKARKEARKS